MVPFEQSPKSMSLAEIYWMFLMLLLSVHTEAQSAIEYTFNTGRATWNQAQRHCEERGSKLLTLKTEEKYRSYTGFYLELTRNETTQKASQWIGLYDSNPPNMSYTWTDGTPLSPLFSPWTQIDGEPNSPKTQQCVRMKWDFEWRTTSCESTIEFTCERVIANCWFEKIDGRLENIAIISSDSLDDCQSKCLKRSICGAFQLRDSKCYRSKSDIVTAYGDEVTYRKVCINYTITDDDFGVENPPLTKGTVDCSSVSTTMQENFGQSTVHSHSSQFLTSLSHKQSPMTTDLKSTPSFENYEASPMTKPPASNHFTSEYIEISPMTIDLQLNPYSTAGGTEASRMTTDVQLTPNLTDEDIEESAMTTNLSFIQMSKNIEGPPTESSYISTTIRQIVSTSNEKSHVSSNYLLLETSTVLKDILTTEELRPTQPMTDQPSSSQLVHLTTGSSITLRSVSTKCTCVCKKRRGKVDEKISDTKKRLTLNTTRLSSFIRKKTSAMDSRTTARASGMLGVAIFVLTGLGLIFMDAITLGPELCRKRLD